MAQKQARLAREKQAGGGKLPPWKQSDYEANNIEMNGNTAEAMVRLVDEALRIPGSPVRELMEIRSLAVQAIDGFSKSRKAPKYPPRVVQEASQARKQALEIFRKASTLSDQLDDRLAFDLWNRESWGKSDTPKAQP